MPCVLGGVDLLLIETVIDTLNAKAAIYAALYAVRGDRLRGADSPSPARSPTPRGACSRGRRRRRSGTRSGTREPLFVGLNCALGGAQLRPYVEELARVADTYVCAYPERRAPQRLRRVRRGAAADRRHPARVRRGGARQHRRRLLRHHARAHPPAARGDRGGARRAARGRAAGEVPALRARAAQHRRRQPVRQRRRAHQRHRLGQVPQADRGRRLRARRSRWRASRSRAARRSSTSTWTRACSIRRAAMTRFLHLVAVRARHRARAGDDRLLQVVGDRGGPEVRAGQADRQLDQPQGGRGSLHRARARGAPLRRRRGGDGLRRAGPGRHARAALGGLRARLPHPHRAGRASRPRTSSSIPTSSRSPPASRSTTATAWRSSRRRGASSASCRTRW